MVDKAYLLSLKPDDITQSLIEDLFAYKFVDKKVQKPKYEPSDEFVLKKGEYFNKTDVTTTVGEFIFNKFIIETNFKDVVGYVNEPVDKKQLGKIEDKLTKALTEDIITPEQFANYINQIQWFGLNLMHITNGSFTSATIKPNPKVIKRRDELFKQNKEALDNGDVITSVQIEKELLTLAKSELKGDHGMDLYNSGSRGSFDNNYKNMAIMRGAAYNPCTGKYDVIETSFLEGIEKKDIPAYGTMVVSGAYPKAVGTQVGEDTPDYTGNCI